MKTSLLIVLGVASVLSAAGSANAATAAQDFVTKASAANEFEIESSKLALEKSQDRNIKAFAQQMIDDHTKTGQKLRDALSTSTSHAEAKDQLDDKGQKNMDKLNSLSGDDFNKEYVSEQTSAHKEAVSLFSDYAGSGDDPTLKSFASDTLPTLKMHLQHVQELKTTH